MEEFMTIDEVLATYPDEWVLLNEIETDEHQVVLGGVVVGHDPLRSAVETLAIAMKMPRCAMVCAKLRNGEPMVSRDYAVSPITSSEEIESEVAKIA